MSTQKYTIETSFSGELEVEVSYTPATGDGWHEPREEAYYLVESVKGFRVDEDGNETTEPVTWESMTKEEQEEVDKLAEAAAKEDEEYHRELAAEEKYDRIMESRTYIND